MIRWQSISRVILFIVVMALPLSESLAQQDVACQAIRKEIKAKEVLGFRKEHPERRLGHICAYGTVKCDGSADEIPLEKLTNRGLKLNGTEVGYLLGEGEFFEVAEIDINNDGLEDLWFTRVVGSAICQKNCFFLRTRDGHYVCNDFLGFPALIQPFYFVLTLSGDLDILHA